MRLAAGANGGLDLFWISAHTGIAVSAIRIHPAEWGLMSIQHASTDEVQTFLFRGFEIPIDLANMTGGGADGFEIISNDHIYLLRQLIELNSKHNVLEVGCGIGRDAIPLTEILDAESNYLGIDIIARSIAWCTDNITSRFENFKFACFNVEDQLHNPGGNTKTIDITLPCADDSIDRIFLWSVFTHMAAPDITHYLKEFHRVLKPGGMIFATFFVVNQEIIAATQAKSRTIFDLRFEHPYGDGCFVNDLAHPMGAVAYTISKLRDMVEEASLSFRYPILFGGWSGVFPRAAIEAGQDAIVLFKKDKTHAQGVLR